MVISETAGYLVKRDYLGRTMKLCKGYATIPLPLDYPVMNMGTWLAIKPMFEFSEDWVDLSRIDRVKERRKQGCLVAANIPGGFDLPRQLMGEEMTCLSYYEQPEWMHDILETLGETAYRTLGIVSRHVTIDQLSVHEDFAGKSGPLVGPRQVREFIKPCYRRVWDMLESRGAVIFQQDSDGNANDVIDAFIDCGVNCFYPMEPAAGMDIVEVKRRYGNQVMMLGGIDKHVLRQGKDAIGRELEYKMQPMMQRGGMVSPVYLVRGARLQAFNDRMTIVWGMSM